MINRWVYYHNWIWEWVCNHERLMTKYVFWRTFSINRVKNFCRDSITWLILNAYKFEGILWIVIIVLVKKGDFGSITYTCHDLLRENLTIYTISIDEDLMNFWKWSLVFKYNDGIKFEPLFEKIFCESTDIRKYLL